MLKNFKKKLWHAKRREEKKKEKKRKNERASSLNWPVSNTALLYLFFLFLYDTLLQHININQI